MRQNFLPTAIALFALPASLFLTGCETTESATEVPAEAALDITKGSSTEDLIALMGEPTSIEPYEKDPKISVWTYEERKSITNMVAYDTQEVPFVDPFTGEMKMLQEPLYKEELVTNVVKTIIYVTDNTVLAWKVETEADRSIND